MSFNTLRQGRQKIGIKMYPSSFKSGTLLKISYNNRQGYHWLVYVSETRFIGLACSIIMFDAFKKSTSTSKLTNVVNINKNGWNFEPINLRSKDRTNGKTIHTINPSELPLYVSWHKTKEFEDVLKS